VKKKAINTDKKLFTSLEFEFFLINLEFAFRIWPYRKLFVMLGHYS